MLNEIKKETNAKPNVGQIRNSEVSKLKMLKNKLRKTEMYKEVLKENLYERLKFLAIK
jgi:hypothetical protein